MSNDEWKTIRVPPEDWKRAKAQKDAADRKWGEQIVRPDDDRHADLKAAVREVLREELPPGALR